MRNVSGPLPSNKNGLDWTSRSVGRHYASEAGWLLVTSEEAGERNLFPGSVSGQAMTLRADSDGGLRGQASTASADKDSTNEPSSSRGMNHRIPNIDRQLGRAWEAKEATCRMPRQTECLSARSGKEKREM